MNTKILNISRRVGLLDLFNEKGFRRGVEVGTDRGGYAKDICERMPGVELFTIDPWLPYNEGQEVKDVEKMKEIQQEARDVLSPFPNCTIIHDTSINTVKTFKPNSLDFVFIDGNHEYDYVLQDIIEWSNIVKPGGIIAGHDYKEDKDKKYGVMEAVELYVKMNKIDPLYILKKGSFVPCWMFYKV